MIFNHTAHRELWDWLANNPGEFKSEWPGWKDYPDVKNRHNECFACECCSNMCKDCPLVWPRGECTSSPSAWRSHLFEVWLDRSVALRFMAGKEDSPRIIRRRKAIANMARKIRDLPVKEGVEVI